MTRTPRRIAFTAERSGAARHHRPHPPRACARRRDRRWRSGRSCRHTWRAAGNSRCPRSMSVSTSTAAGLPQSTSASSAARMVLPVKSTSSTTITTDPSMRGATILRRRHRGPNAGAPGAGGHRGAHSDRARRPAAACGRGSRAACATARASGTPRVGIPDQHHPLELRVALGDLVGETDRDALHGACVEQMRAVVKRLCETRHIAGLIRAASRAGPS